MYPELSFLYVSALNWLKRKTIWQNNKKTAREIHYKLWTNLPFATSISCLNLVFCIRQKGVVKFGMLKGTLSGLKYHILKLWPVPCFNSALWYWNRMRKMLKVVKKKEISTKKKKIPLKGSKFYQNGSFDFWTSCPKINCNSLSSLQSFTPSSK